MTGLEFAAVALIGVLLGRFLPNRRKGPKPVKPVCGCDHHHAHHDPATGKCHAAVEVPSKYDIYGAVVAWTNASCACRQYSGPQPMPEFFAPEVTA